MNKITRQQRNSGTSAAGLARLQARNERRRRTSFWQFFRAEGEASREARSVSQGIETSQR